MDTIVTKTGDAYRGALQHKSFSIVATVGPLKIPKADIAQIMFNVAAYAGKDQIFTYASRFTGDVVEDPIKIKLESGRQAIQVPQADIVAIHVGLGD